MQAAAKTLGALTTVVNSAGISVPGNIEDETLEGFRRTIAINLEGTFLGCKHGVAALKAQDGAAIVNVGSTLGAKAGSIFPAYSASKGGVHMLTKAAALHCAEQGYDIRVNAMLPGAIHTEMVEGYIAAGIAAGLDARSGDRRLCLGPPDETAWTAARAGRRHRLPRLR